MPVKDSQDGYAFLYPFGWQEVTVDGQVRSNREGCGGRHVKAAAVEAAAAAGNSCKQQQQ